MRFQFRTPVAGHNPHILYPDPSKKGDYSFQDRYPSELEERLELAHPFGESGREHDGNNVTGHSSFSAGPDLDQFRNDADSDLLRGLGADGKADGGVYPFEVRLAEAFCQQLL